MNLRDYLRTSEAAKFLGVSPGTVRNWDRQGKLKARRLPHNGYRLFLKSELEAFLREVEQQGEPSSKSRRSSRRDRA